MPKSKIYLALLIAIGLMVTLRGFSYSEPYYNGDEPRHLMTGVFFRDLIVDFPASHPLEYTYKYYAKYPALGLIHWPPLFHMVEGIFFLILGVSKKTAVLSVIAFALMLLVFWYRLIARVYNHEVALFSGLLLAAAPAFIEASRAVMLEVPSLALCVASIYFFYIYIETGKRKHACYFALSLAAALLTKQTSMFLLPLFALYLFASGRVEAMKRRELRLALSLAMAPVIFYYWLAFELHRGAIMADLLRGTWAENHLLRWDNYLLYPKLIPAQVGPMVAIMGLLFVAAIAASREYKKHMLFLVWLIACYATFTLVAQKDTRYVIYWIPPLALFPVLLLARLKPRAGLIPIPLSALLMLGLSAAQLARAFETEGPFISGYQEAAKYVASNLGQRDTVLFDGHLDGTFIFYLRRHDPRKRLVVLRSDKLLYSANILPEYGLHIYRNDPKSIYDLIDSYGTKYIVIESRDIARYQSELEPRKILRQVLCGPDFELVRTIEVKSNLRNLSGLQLLIYRYANSRPLKCQELEIPMPSLGGKVLKVKLP